mgnify:FL=1
MLEDQLQRARRRSDHVFDLEGEILKLNQQINELTLVSNNNFLKFSRGIQVVDKEKFFFFFPV